MVYEDNQELTTRHSLEVYRTRSYVDAIVAAVTAFWHIARLGILALSFSEFLRPKDEVEKQQKSETLRKAANWMTSLMNANPTVLRPLLDLHHIELFLLWRTLWQVGRRDDIYKWLHGLRNCLLVRRAGAIPLPFIEGGNSLELVFECVATGEKPPEFCDQSSLLMLCILEFCYSLEPARRHELIAAYYHQIVLGRDSFGANLKDCAPLNLMGWSPPNDWGTKVLDKSLSDESESQMLEPFDIQHQTDGAAIATRLEDFIRQSRNAAKTTFPDGLPASVIVLACLKNRSPLPSELWRIPIFGKLTAENSK